jgi:hypothetical protein
MSRCYGSGHSGRETKQALSRYKVLTVAIITARRSQRAGRRRGSAVRTRCEGRIGDSRVVAVVGVGRRTRYVVWAGGVKPVHPGLRNDGEMSGQMPQVASGV